MVWETKCAVLSSVDIQKALSHRSWGELSLMSLESAAGNLLSYQTVKGRGMLRQIVIPTGILVAPKLSPSPNYTPSKLLLHRFSVLIDKPFLVWPSILQCLNFSEGERATARENWLWVLRELICYNFSLTARHDKETCHTQETWLTLPIISGVKEKSPG